MPVIKDLGEDPVRWFAGLPDISRHLEEQHPDTPLGVIGSPPDTSSRKTPQTQAPSSSCTRSNIDSQEG